MGPIVKDKHSKTMPKGGPQSFYFCFIFLLVHISSFAVPVRGFSLKSCRISYDNAICTKTQLTAVPHDIPSTVKGFYLSENKIQNIKENDFKTLSGLTQLDLKRNRISTIDTGAFANLISLKIFSLNNNKLEELGDDIFGGLSNLTELRIGSNHIKRVASTSFKSLTSLTFLDISKNQLHHVTKVHSILQQLPNLKTLIVKNNWLTTFESWQLTNNSIKLAALDLSKNPIAVFRITEDVFPNLTWLSIGAPPKKLKMKWDIHNKTFLSRVSTLDISGLQMDHDDMKTLRENFNPSLTALRMNDMRHTRLTALINVSCTIPTVSKLQLRQNNLLYVSSNLFELCINVKELDLSKNHINNIEEKAFSSLKSLRILSLSQNKLPSIPAATRNLPTLEELNLSHNEIQTLKCNDFANLTKLKELSLNQNSISAIDKFVFKGLIRLQVLKLHNNSISKLGDAFKTHLPQLIQLRLNLNKLNAIKPGELSGLQSLQNLSLNENKIKKLEKGCFLGLTNLTYIQLNSNTIREHQLKGVFDDLINLISLDLRDNKIKYTDSTALSDPPFSKLSHLESLVIRGNSRREKSLLPRNFLQGLTNLLEFNARNTQLLSLHKDTFTYTPRLLRLDISSNDLSDLSPELFYPIPSLEALYISRTSLQSLDFLIDANLTKLVFLQGRRNQYSVFSEELIKSLPALVYIDIQGNSFTCDCSNAWFRDWVVNDKQTQVFDAYNFKCNYPPDLKGTKLFDLDVQSCTVDNEFICYISTTCTILMFMVASFTYHFLRWQLVYAYYLFLALLFDKKHKNKQAPRQYDAFISYNTHDEPWVTEVLLPELEGVQGWKLCLHHRDFEPGKPIIDNITDAIYGSRKTICVISRRYLESEWCSREIQVASFRLFDEQKDVLILVFLEEIPITQLSPYYRMRKLLKRRTFLSWPRAGEHPELFWEKLRQALKTKDDLNGDKFLLTVVDRP